MIVTVCPAGIEFEYVTVEALSTEHVPMLAAQVPGKASNPPGNVVVATALTAALPLLVIVIVPVTVLPGPVQASGSLADAAILLTVTLNEHEFELLAASLTEQVTVVTPSGNAEPDAGVQTGAPTPEQLSLTDGAA